MGGFTVVKIPDAVKNSEQSTEKSATDKIRESKKKKIHQSARKV